MTKADARNQHCCRVANNPWGYGVGYLPYDGAIIETGTLPGAWYGGYNVGMNLVHETGHWCVAAVCNASVKLRPCANASRCFQYQAPSVALTSCRFVSVCGARHAR